MTSSRHVIEPHSYSYMKLAAAFTQQYTRLPSRRNIEGFPPPIRGGPSGRFNTELRSRGVAHETVMARAATRLRTASR